MALINCPECGKQISDKAEMCNGCGFPLHINGKLFNCPECGKQVSDKAEMCTNCGFPINLKTPQRFLPKKKKSPNLKVLIWSIVLLCTCGVTIYFLNPSFNFLAKKQFERKTLSTINGKEVCKLETFISVKMPDGKVKNFLNGKYEESFNLTKQILVQGFYVYDSNQQRSCKNGEWVKYDEYGKLLNKSYYDLNYNLKFDVDLPIQEQFYNDNLTVSKIILRDKGNTSSNSPKAIKEFYPNGQLKHHSYNDYVNGQKQFINLYYDLSGNETDENGRKYWSEIELRLLIAGAESWEVKKLLGEPNKIYSGLRGDFYLYRNLIRQDNKTLNGWIHLGGIAYREYCGRVVNVSIYQPNGIID